MKKLVNLSLNKDNDSEITRRENMKKVVPLSVLSAALVFASVGFLRGNSYKEVLASSYSTSSVTKNINLNDLNDSDIRAYYSNLNSLSESERQGTNLLKNLKPILKNGQTYFSYGSSATTAVWQMYEIVDRDWEKSPASAITGYNPATNTITNYSYGKSASSPGMNPYIHALYVNRDKENGTRAWGDHTQTNYGINQEHIWPKSAGFGQDEYGTGARGDIMHLWAGNGRVNGYHHNNWYYGYVDKNKSFEDAGSDYSYLAGNLKGTSKTFGGSNPVFEPQDSDKGDIARAIFYMAARYNYLSGSDSDGIDSGNPNLEVVNNVSSFVKAEYYSTTTKTGKMGILQDLLEWNRIDPPDEWEIHRNNLCYNNYTHNRNPFIDFPQWAEYVWGQSNNGTYVSTPTGAANPTTDSINDSALKLEEVSTPSTTFKVGATKTLKATTEDASPITWAIEDNTIVSLDKTSTASGESVVVTALKDGQTKVTATATVDGKQQSKSFRIVVGEQKSSGGGGSTPQTDDGDGQQSFDFKAFFEANKMWVIIGGAGLLVLLIVVIILFAKFGSKKAKKKVNKAIKKTVKKSVKNQSKKK